MQETVETPDLSSLPDQLLTMLEESIVPSPHSIDLSRTPLTDYLYRQVRKKPHVAELYHENSKINPHSTLQPIDNPVVLEQIRHWFFSTAYELKEEDYVLEESPELRFALDELPESVADLLRPFTEAGAAANLLYSIDLLVLRGGLLARLFPESPYLWTEREVPDQERAFLGSKFGLAPDDWEGTEAVLFVVACPWRYMLLHGPRGYRHTLLDVGRLLAYFEGHTAEHGLDLTVAQNFHDTAVDNSILADGLERSAYAVLTLRTPQEEPQE